MRKNTFNHHNIYKFFVFSLFPIIAQRVQKQKPEEVLWFVNKMIKIYININYNPLVEKTSAAS